MPATNAVLNEDRYVDYSPTTATDTFAVPFPVWAGTLAEAKGDLEVRVDGIPTTEFSVTGTIDTSATPHVILDASVVLDVSVDDVLVEIEGNAAPRRIHQYPDGVGVAPRYQNAILNFCLAAVRDIRQKVGRALRVPYGEAPVELPAAADRAEAFLWFDADGQPTAVPSGNVVTLAGLADEIAALAARTTELDALYGIRVEIDGVYDIRAELLDVWAVRASVVTVAARDAEIATLAGLDTEIAGVYAIRVEVEAVHLNATNINTVAGIESDVQTLAPRVGDIQTLAPVAPAIQIVADNIGALNDKQDLDEKGQPDGYASLDSGGKVPASQLPSYVDDILEYADLAAFPATGDTGKMYVALDTNKTYRWSGSAYVEISPSPGSTDSVTEGSTNLYFTAARVRATVLTGLSTAVSTVVAATDTVLEALGKLQAQVSLRAPLASPALTGTPTAPTAAAGTNTTQIATMAALQTGLADKPSAAEIDNIVVCTQTEYDGLTPAATTLYLIEE